MHTLDDYTFALPSHLIAQQLASPPESCKMLVCSDGKNEHHVFSEFPQLLNKGTHLFFNNSKVLKARLLLPSIDGEIFFLTQHGIYEFDALVRPGKKCKPGVILSFIDGITFEVVSLTEDGRRIRCSHPILDVLEEYGQMPFPPYIEYQEERAESYQPYLAKNDGSVAAPTASLHFSEKIMTDLKKKGHTRSELTLHIGLGTFKQVNVDTISTYDIHKELCVVPMSIFEEIFFVKKAGKDCLAVGTTVTRTLESLPYLWKVLPYQQKALLGSDSKQFRDSMTAKITDIQAKEIIHGVSIGYDSCSFETKLFLFPGGHFYIIDQLVTNFHLPKSSLLMLVAGFMGFEEMKESYECAIKNEYSFFSFGDAMRIPSQKIQSSTFITSN